MLLVTPTVHKGRQHVFCLAAPCVFCQGRGRVPRRESLWPARPVRKSFGCCGKRSQIPTVLSRGEQGYRDRLLAIFERSQTKSYVPHIHTKKFEYFSHQSLFQGNELSLRAYLLFRVRRPFARSVSLKNGKMLERRKMAGCTVICCIYKKVDFQGCQHPCCGCRRRFVFVLREEVQKVICINSNISNVSHRKPE